MRLSHLARLAAAGLVEELREHIAAGCSVSGKESNGATPLHAAAGNGQIECMQVLIDAGASVEAKDDRGETPLFRAARQGSLPAGELLLAAGAEINAISFKDGTALHACIRSVSAGQDKSERIGFIAMLVNKSADLSTADGDGMHPIHRAAMRGFVEAIGILASAGVPVDQRDSQSDSWTPLMWASKFAQPAAIEWSVQHGADINARSSVGGYTPLHLVALESIPLSAADTAARLLSLGADLNVLDGSGRSADAYVNSNQALQTVFSASRARSVMDSIIGKATAGRAAGDSKP